MKKNILFLLQGPNIGGAERVAINLANKLTKNKNFKIYFIFINYLNKNRYFSKGIIIKNFYSKSTLLSFYKINKFIKSKNNVILFSSIFHLNIFSCLIYLINKKKIKKLIIRETTILSKYFSKNKNLKNFILNKLITFFYNKYPHKIIAPNTAVKNNLISYKRIRKKKIEIISNPINFEYLRCMSNMKIKNKKLNNIVRNKKFKKIAIFGRIEQEKNIDFLSIFKQINLMLI